MRNRIALPWLLSLAVLPTFMGEAAAAPNPPALISAALMKHGLSFSECQIRTLEILERLHLEIDDHDNGTIFGYGDKSAVSVNCHKISEDTVYIPIAVASQKQEAAELIMRYVMDYLKGKSKATGDEAPIDARPSRRVAE